MAAKALREVSASLIEWSGRSDHEFKLLRQNPTAGPERSNEPAKNLVSIWQVAKHQAKMHEIEFRQREGIGFDIVPADFQIRSVQRFEELSIYVGRKYVPVAADPVAEPRCDAASSSPDFQAMPTVANADFRKVPDRSGIEDIGQR